MKPDLNWLVGSVVERVEYDEQCRRWNFAIGEQTFLAVECHWQIITGDHVSLASGDHGQIYGRASSIDAAVEAMNLLAGRKIERVSFDEMSADLTIELEGAAAIRTFNDSTGFEAWHLIGPQGTRLIAQGGGNIVVFPGEQGA